MTVSRALSNNPNVRKETKDAVIKRARELGYVKSAAATAMRGERTAIIGLLLPNLVNEFYARFADSLTTCLERCGLQLMIFLTNDELRKECGALMKLHELQAKAVVMVPTPGIQADQEQYLGDLQVVQVIRTRGDKANASVILINDEKPIKQAVAFLTSQGHSRIAYIGGSPVLSSGASRLAAFSQGMMENGLTLKPDCIITDMPSFSMGFQAAEKVLAQGRMTAVVCGGFEISNGVLNCLLQRDVRVGKDISFIGYGDPSYYRWINNGISTIKLPVLKLAEKTAQIVGNNSDLYKKETIRAEVHAELIFRGSSAPAAGNLQGL